MQRNQCLIFVEESREALSEAGARLFERRAVEAVENSGAFFVALSGGTTPRAMHKRLAFRPSVPWHGVHVFWGDERCVPADDPSSNYGAARVDFLDKVPLPAGHIHPMPAHVDPKQGALLYARELRQVFKLKQAQAPVFDLVFLGLGKDGHTASLFPGHKALEDHERPVVAVKGGDPDLYRLTLTFGVINNAGEVVFLVSGKDKAETLRAVIEAQEPRLPASRVRPSSGRLTWLLDRGAASLLTEKIRTSRESGLSK